MLLVAGLPFRLSLQYWRFAGIDDLMGVVASSALGAVLFASMLTPTGVPLGNPAFPVIHALTLIALLGTPRVVYRRFFARTAGRPRDDAARSVLLVGSGEDADLFLRALAQDRRQGFRVEGLLAIGSRQTGRRIQGHPSWAGSPTPARCWTGSPQEGRLPDMLVIATPNLSGADSPPWSRRPSASAWRCAAPHAPRRSAPPEPASRWNCARWPSRTC